MGGILICHKPYILTMTLVETSALFIVLIIITSIVWGTLRTGISPMMSSYKARKAMLDLLENRITHQSNGAIMDLGSGWGGLLFNASKQYPDRDFIGYELSWLPYLFSVVRKHALGLNNLRIYRKDFLKADLHQADAVLCYLYPKAMEKLEFKLTEEQNNELTIISSTFALPNEKAQNTVKLNDFYGTPIYCYHWSPAHKQHQDVEASS